nr:uncharacterized protein I203_04211 [Kwoniella mangroviensis CBS 8507]OCF66635.1 hypothetical protein I203_04211 [Kwoniella mangroviensis CBS 8507]
MTLQFDPKAIASQLTIEEACSLLHGKDFWRLNGVPRLGVPAGLKLSDGPNGARGEDFVGGTSSACFPAGVCLAATFDIDAARKIGNAIAEECRSKSASAILGPTVNIHRSPLGGRNFESYSEDPVVAGNIASGYIQGVQEKGVAATIKHFICNDSELDRRVMNVQVEEKPLREIYLRPFEIVFRQAKPKAMMTAYNKVNGEYVSDSARLINGIVREEWRAKDVLVMSDWWATYSLKEAVMAGMDLEMPDHHFRGGKKLVKAAKEDPELADAVRERAETVLGLIQYAGGYDLPPERPETAEDKPEHRELIQSVAASGAVLLKNKNDVLPLSTSTPIAAAGLYASEALIHGGGSASLYSHHRVSPIEGISQRFPKATLIRGPNAYNYCPLPENNVATRPDGEYGMMVEFFQPDGTLVETRPLSGTFLTALDRYPKGLQMGWTATMSFRLKAATSGRHTLSIASCGPAELFVNGQSLCVIVPKEEDPNLFLMLSLHKIAKKVEYDFAAGQSYDVKINYTSNDALLYATSLPANGLHFGFAEAIDEDKIISDAVEAAEQIGTAVLCVGHGPDYETEGFDREDISLLGRQNEFIERVADSSAKVIVVVYAGSPIAMPWLDKVDAVIYAWFPGQELGHALADVISGEVNPSGRLPVTFPKRIEDNPSHGNFPGENQKIAYAEGCFVGYRHYASKNIPTLFPFGSGLSYTSFSVSDLQLAGQEAFGPGQNITVSVTVTNTGLKSGRHTVLVFVTPPEGSSRPVLSLEGFAKTQLLQPGTQEEVVISLAEDAFSHWAGGIDGSWEIEPGNYTIQILQDAGCTSGLSQTLNIPSGWERDYALA